MHLFHFVTIGLCFVCSVCEHTHICELYIYFREERDICFREREICLVCFLHPQDQSHCQMAEDDPSHLREERMDQRC